MRRTLLLKLQVLLAIAAICSGQLIMGTPLGNEFSQSSFNDQSELNEEDLQKIVEMDQIENEIEDSLQKAEEMIEGLHNKIENKDVKISDEEMLSTLKESVAQLHQDQEKQANKDISKDIKLAKNLIGESALDEISDEIKENMFFNGGESVVQSLEEKTAQIEAKKKEIQDMIKEEKSWLRNNRNKLKDLEDVSAPQTKFTEEAQSKKKKTNALVKAQKKSAKKIEDIVNKHIQNNTPEGKEAKKTSFFDFDIQEDSEEDLINTMNNQQTFNQKEYITDVIDNIFGENKSDDTWETDILTQKNEAQIIEEDGKRLQALKQTYSDEESEQQLEQDIDELLTVGDQLHEKFLDDNNLLETLFGNQNYPASNGDPIIFDQDEGTEVSAKLTITDPEVSLEKKLQIQMKLQDQEKARVQEEIDEKKKQEIEDEKNTFFKQMVFTIVVVLAILFMIFGSQFDLFSFFSQRRRAKDPFYRDDEAQQSLIN